MSERLVLSLKGSPDYVDGRQLVASEIEVVPAGTIALTFENSNTSDTEILALPFLPDLRCLDLDGTAISDQSLVVVSQMAALEELWLEGTGITDEGLKELGRAQSLRFISLAYTATTCEGVETLRLALPSAQITV